MNPIKKCLPSLLKLNRNFIQFSKVQLHVTSSFSLTEKRELSEKSEKVKELLENATTFSEEKSKEGSEWLTSPYPKGTYPRNQALHSLRPQVDPRETSIILFPGQGVQYVGMGKKLTKFPSVIDIFESASSVVKYDVLKLCLEGPESKLNLTNYQQVAILTCSIAAVEALKEERPSVIENCVATAGFSVGELAALVFADVISFEDAVRLVKIRGQAMQAAAEISPGAMLTVFYGPDSLISLAFKDAIQFAHEQGISNPYCGVSNYLFPHCKIIAGHLPAIEFIENNKSNYKLKKLRRLPVSGAFHTPLMQPAVEVFKAALSRIKLSEPIISVHSNVDGKRYRSSDHVKKILPKQIVAPVKWEQTLHILYERTADTGFPQTYECGPGKSLNTILKMVNAKAWESLHNVPV